MSAIYALEFLEVSLIELSVGPNDKLMKGLPGSKVGLFCVCFAKLDRPLLPAANNAAEEICARLAPDLMYRSSWLDPVSREKLLTTDVLKLAA